MCYLYKLLIIVYILFSTTSFLLASTNVVLSKDVVHGAISYTVKANLSDQSIQVAIGLPAKGLSHSTSFISIIDSRLPLAAITGTFFDPKTLRLTGTVIMGGTTLFRNDIGTALIFHPGNKIEFITTRGGVPFDIRQAVSAIRAGPRLLESGAYSLNLKKEGFRLLSPYTRRVGVVLGTADDGKLLLTLVKTPSALSKLASIMKTLGAKDAVRLDGGSSAALYFKGRIVYKPSRLLTNTIGAYARKQGELLLRKLPIYAELTAWDKILDSSRNQPLPYGLSKYSSSGRVLRNLPYDYLSTLSHDSQPNSSLFSDYNK